MVMIKENWRWVVIVVLALAALAATLYIRKRAAKGTDIKWPDLPEWDSGSVDASLGKLHGYAIGFCNSSILWYQLRRWPKRTAGFLLRVGALLATMTAGLVPLMDPVPAVTTTFLIAAAGLFVSIDTLGGFTSGWVRYMLAQQKIERLRDGFLIDWSSLKAAASDPQLFLERVRAFLLAVGKVVDDETQEWATEFQNALKDLERSRKAEAEAQRTGALEITVKNPPPSGWSLEIDGTLRGHTTGKTLAVADVLLGPRKVRSFGLDAQGKTLSDEKIVKIEAATTSTREMEPS